MPANSPASSAEISPGLPKNRTPHARPANKDVREQQLPRHLQQRCPFLWCVDEAQDPLVAKGDFLEARAGALEQRDGLCAGRRVFVRVW